MIFSWFGWVLYWRCSPFHLECVYVGLLYPFLTFDMFIVVWGVHARWSGLGFYLQLFFYSVCVWVCVLEVLCVWGCKVLNPLVALFPLFVYVYTCLCIYVCMCECFHLDAFVWEHVWRKVELMGIQWDFNLLLFVVWMFLITYILCLYIYIY